MHATTYVYTYILKMIHFKNKAMFKNCSYPSTYFFTKKHNLYDNTRYTSQDTMYARWNQSFI